MQSIGETLTKERKVSKANSERASIIEYFVQPLIEERRETNFERFKEYSRKNPGKSVEDFKKTKEFLRPLSARTISILMAKVPTEDLHPFFKQCINYKGGFSRAFFGALKIKR